LKKKVYLSGMSILSILLSLESGCHSEVWLEVMKLGRRSVYSGPMLFDLAITFLVERSFTDKPKGSNSIEYQLSVVKRRIERKL
jgi:hypothetical protein